MRVDVRLIDRDSGMMLVQYGHSGPGRVSVRLALDALAADARGGLRQLDVDRLFVDVVAEPAWLPRLVWAIRRRLWLT